MRYTDILLIIVNYRLCFGVIYIKYSEALDFIHGISRLGSKLGLERVRELLERIGCPQDKLSFVHVAGTNGKGSTCTMLSYILAEAGFKTGLYISPFVLDFRERIQVGNKMISEEELVESTAFVKQKWDEMNAEGKPPTEFEVVVAIAFDYFVRSRCDVVVLEVGLGGRLDATNVIASPLCSVITNIGIDHTELLGNTISEITAEKCGIIKENGMTVTYPRQDAEALGVIEAICEERHNRLIVPGEASVVSMDINGSVIEYGGASIRIPLSGEHQVFNAVTVVEAVKALRLKGFEIPDESVAAGISKTMFPSRLETLCEKPLILLDGAHNLLGAQALAKSLEMLGGRKIHAVVAFMSDKDADGILREVLPYCHTVTAYRLPQNPRSMPVTEVMGLAAKYCDRVYAAGTIDAALIQPVFRSGGGDAVLIFGSLYFASIIRPVAKSLNLDLIKRLSDKI